MKALLGLLTSSVLGLVAAPVISEMSEKPLLSCRQVRRSVYPPRERNPLHRREVQRKPRGGQPLQSARW